MRSIPVWDLSTRLFHWTLATAVIVCIFTGEDKGIVFIVHAYAGYLAAMLVVFRIAWGVVGSPRSRFGDFLYAWPTTRRYALSLLRLKPETFVGHNPLGGWWILVILTTVAAAAGSGILYAATGSHAVEEIHETLGSLIQIVVLVHLAGVVGDSLIAREGRVRAMITGRRRLADDEAGSEPPLAGMGRAAVLALLVLAAGAYVHQVTEFGAAVSQEANKKQRERH